MIGLLYNGPIKSNIYQYEEIIMDNTTIISKGFYVTGEEKVRVNLVTGLEFVIAQLGSCYGQPLEMWTFGRCALGQGLPEHINHTNCESLIKKYFGVKPTDSLLYDSCVLSESNVNVYFTPRTAKVMNLFTSNVGYTIQIKDWLKLANTVLLELKETK